MKPLKLKMQAFGSYGEETLIDFEKVNQNLFLITGDTGAGKTTIFDAIVFALYGEASSSANKKEGVVLQSQYVDFAKEPFVELTFSEGNNADSEIYTVRRVPRHLKPITRGTGKGGQREITGSVSLIMPDGMEYPSKEADSKLREIVGLTKSQFMQVAMIAQGEFMDLLRAKSDDKKVIFRKLFNTEMYQDIVTELGNRKREKDKEIAILKTQCQTEAVRIRISETYEFQKEMQQSKRQIEEGQMAGLADFMDRLEALCDWMKKELENAERVYQESECARTGKGEELAKAEELLKQFDRVILACGASNPRDIKVPGRDAKGIYFAVDFLGQVTKALLDSDFAKVPYELAKGKNVLVIGGGDTGNDCVGTSIRLGAKSVIQLEMMPKPPVERTPSNPWPQWPRVLKTDYGQEEAIAVFGHDPRVYQTTVTEFIKDKNGNVCQAKLTKLKSEKDPKTGRMMMVPVEGSEEVIPVDVVLIAAGFLGSEKYVTDAFKVAINGRTNVDTKPDQYQTSVDKVFTAGDMHRGQSLVVWAIREGREAAKAVDESLMGYSYL